MNAYSRTILVVDDDAPLRELIVEILAGAGFAALSVANALDALEHVARFGPPALVILDLTMPVMDGQQLLAERRKWSSLSQVPFVLLTGSTDVDAEELGAAEVIVKPATVEKLLTIARRYATGRSGTYSAVVLPTASNGDKAGV